MSKVRMKYEKGNEVKYLGHLDTITMFDRAFRRANIKIKFSQGFNQRACLIFGLPTSTGIESKCEYLEIDIPNEELDIQLLKENLNKVLPIGFRVLDIEIINDNKNIMSKVIESEYEINIIVSKNDIDNYAKKINEIFKQKEVMVLKKSKDNSKKYIDVLPYIIFIKVTNKNNQIKIELKAKSGSKANLRPDYIIQAIENADIDIIDYNILRTSLILDE